MQCQLCNQTMTDFLEHEEQFIRRCPNCLLQWQKLLVSEIIDSFSQPEVHRYTKLLTLDMVNKLPLTDLFEFYLVGKEPFTITEFNNLLTKYEAKKHNEEIRQETKIKKNLLQSLRGSNQSTK